MVLVVFSCSQATDRLDLIEKRKLAEEIFKNGSHLPQGSPKSMTRIEEAIAADTTYAEALRELSVAYLKRGMPHKWLPQFNKAVRHDPKTWVPWRGYLYLYFYRDYKKAIADFNASDTLTKHIDYPQGHSVDFWRGIAYLGLKDYDNSITYWDKHIKKETEDTGEDWVELEAFLYRGIAHYESGNNQKAMKDFNKAIQYFKQTADAKYYKAKILLVQNKKEAAQKMINEAMIDFNSGFHNNYHYVELLHQIYLSDIEELKSEIMR
ncbi:tetratricopeptide repeat protein [Croceitalea vernalis]|uniref:Tetratricopeptide repeat protein n=1 Tax=Croceitalea vernalis TaxID=3075599 RepID=A0ABU3BEY3_9FLAO|nr:tetratricopeptide repeat protein [Croceitalea sp. P007]MDT0620709.1 tetratricopeptide repeat protein [Croceitalea sp. P007]